MDYRDFLYFYQRLSYEKKREYETFLSAAQSGETEFRTFLTRNEDIMEVFSAVLNDHPEVYDLSPFYEMEMQYIGLRKRVLMKFSYLYSIKDMKKIDDKMVEVYNSLQKRNGVDFLDGIVEYFVMNCRYGRDDRVNQNAASSLYFHEAQCSGFARGMKFLCDRKGIPCIVIEGFIKQNGRKENHAWNLVYLDGSYYHICPTTILGSNPDKTLPIFKPTFLLSDRKMQENGFVWEMRDYPICPMNHPLADSRSYSQQGSASGTNANSSLKHFSSLAPLRAYMEEEYKKGNKSVTFILDIGNSGQEKMKYVSNAAMMVAQKLHASGSINYSYDGTSLTVELP